MCINIHMCINILVLECLLLIQLPLLLLMITTNVYLLQKLLRPEWKAHNILILQAKYDERNLFFLVETS